VLPWGFLSEIEVVDVVVQIVYDKEPGEATIREFGNHVRNRTIRFPINDLHLVPLFTSINRVVRVVG
jgi:hypothetical protein